MKCTKLGFLGNSVCHVLCRAREALRQCLPVQLKDSTFSSVLKEDGTTKKWLLQLLSNLGLELTPTATTTATTDNRPSVLHSSLPQSQWCWISLCVNMPYIIFELTFHRSSYTHTCHAKTGPAYHWSARTTYGCQNWSLDHLELPRLVPPLHYLVQGGPSSSSVLTTQAALMWGGPFHGRGLPTCMAWHTTYKCACSMWNLRHHC